MNILITLSNPIPLIIYESLSLAFALASFGHELQLDIDDKVADSLLSHPDSSLTKMLASLDLYDIPPAWVSTMVYQNFVANLTEPPTAQLRQRPAKVDNFDNAINF